MCGCVAIEVIEYTAGIAEIWWRLNFVNCSTMKNDKKGRLQAFARSSYRMLRGYSGSAETNGIASFGNCKWAKLRFMSDIVQHAARNVSENILFRNLSSAGWAQDAHINTNFMCQNLSLSLVWYTSQHCLHSQHSIWLPLLFCSTCCSIKKTNCFYSY